MKVLTLAITFVNVLLLTGCEAVGWLTIAFFQRQHPLSAQLTDAASRGDVSEVDRLLAAGAPLQQPYALQAAVVNRQYETVQHLVNRGAPVNGDGELQSPLWFAAVHGDADMIQLLISIGADVDWQTDHMGTPLHAVLHTFNVDGNRLDVVRMLLDNGADVNRLQNDETLSQWCLATPLHAAVGRLQEPAIRLLIDRGADPRATDAKGRTPLQCARERLHEADVDLRPQIEPIIALLEAEQVVSR